MQTSPFAKVFTDTDDLEATVQALARKVKQQRPVQIVKSSGRSRGGGSSDRFLSSAITVASDSGTPASAVAWTTYDASAYIPQGAKGVILQCRGRSIHGPTGEKAVNVRKESGAIELQVVSVRGTTTSDITSMVNQAKCEVTGSRTFDYEVENDVTEYEIKLVGYYI